MRCVKSVLQGVYFSRLCRYFFTRRSARLLHGERRYAFGSPAGHVALDDEIADDAAPAPGADDPDPEADRRTKAAGGRVYARTRR